MHRDLHLNSATFLPEEFRWFSGIFSSSSSLVISKMLIYRKAGQKPPGLLAMRG
jgi:hypothetical protein